MKAWWLFVGLVGLTLVSGCSDVSDKGELPPPPKTYTEEELSKMPPEAAARIRQAQEYSKGMAESSKPKGEPSQTK